MYLYTAPRAKSFGFEFYSPKRRFLIARQRHLFNLIDPTNHQPNWIKMSQYWRNIIFLQEAMESFASPDEFMMKLTKIWTIFKTVRPSIFCQNKKKLVIKNNHFNTKLCTTLRSPRKLDWTNAILRARCPAFRECAFCHVWMVGVGVTCGQPKGVGLGI